MVLITRSVAVSMTDMVPERSFETYASSARTPVCPVVCPAGAAAAQNDAIIASGTRDLRTRAITASLDHGPAPPTAARN